MSRQYFVGIDIAAETFVACVLQTPWQVVLEPREFRNEPEGFDEFLGYLHQAHAHYHYPQYLWHNDKKLVLEVNADGGRKQYSQDLLIEYASEFIRNNIDRLFFCYLPVTIPHYEIDAPQESVKLYTDMFEEDIRAEKLKGYQKKYLKMPRKE